MLRCCDGCTERRHPESGSDGTGRGSGYIVNHQPVHPTGKTFIRYMTLRKGLVVFANYTGVELRKCAGG